jgi:hypothetical protein
MVTHRRNSGSRQSSKEDVMRSRSIVGVLLLVGLFGVALFANGEPVRRTAIVNFQDPVLVAGQFVMGAVVIVHDDLKMSRGEPCTTFYRFAPGQGAPKELVSFHCYPAARHVEDTTKLTVTAYSPAGCRRLIEYQFADDSEGHGVPEK